MDKETRRIFDDVFNMLEGITKQLQIQSELNESLVSILIDKKDEEE
tara:strand:- start:1489 stop:1626 length:138 start_codon:yes stop_codon:yes gene_type:complete